MMTANQTMDKMMRARRYLRDTYGFEEAWVGDACDILNALRYGVRDDAITRRAGRKAARKYGQQCMMTLICGEHPISRTIDELSANEAVKLAVKAAKNAFWAHPELRA